MIESPLYRARYMVFTQHKLWHSWEYLNVMADNLSCQIWLMAFIIVEKNTRALIGSWFLNEGCSFRLMVKRTWESGCRFINILVSEKIIIIKNYITRIKMPQTANFMGQTWGPPGPCQPQMGPMLAPCWPHEPCYQGPTGLVLINELLGTVLAGYDKVILGLHHLNWYAVYQYNVNYGKLHNIHMYL